MSKTVICSLFKHWITICAVAASPAEVGFSPTFESSPQQFELDSFAGVRTAVPPSLFVQIQRLFKEHQDQPDSSEGPKARTLRMKYCKWKQWHSLWDLLVVSPARTKPAYLIRTKAEPSRFKCVGKLRNTFLVHIHLRKLMAIDLFSVVFVQRLRRPCFVFPCATMHNASKLRMTAGIARLKVQPSHAVAPAWLPNVFPQLATLGCLKIAFLLEPH